MVEEEKPNGNENIFKVDFEQEITNKKLENIFTENFKIELSIPEFDYSINYEEDRIKISPSVSLDDIVATFTLINPTIEETYVSEDSSYPVLLLKESEPKSFKLKKNPTGFLSSPMKTTARVLTTAGRVLSDTGTVFTIITNLVEFDISGALYKVIQFVNFFDKLRMINTRMKNRLGEFMEIMSRMFENSFLTKDDAQVVDKPYFNMFSRLNVSSVAFRRKPFKLIMLGIAIALGIIRVLYLRRIPQIKSLVRLEKISRFVKIITKVISSLVLSSLIEIFFYCGHQLIHQNPESVIKKASYFISFFSSMILFLTATYFSVKVVKKLSKEKIKLEIEEHVLSKDNQKVKKVNRIFIRERDSQMDQLTEQNPKENIQLEIDFEKTKEIITIDDFILEFMTQGISRLTIDKTVLFYNLSFPVKILLSCTPLLVFQSMPLVQIVLLFGIETGYLAFILHHQFKHKALDSYLILSIRIIESFTLINYWMFTFFCYLGFDTENNGFFIYESFILWCILLTIGIQYTQLITIILSKIWTTVRIFRAKKKPKVELKGSYEGRSASYWLNHALVRVRVVEKRKVEMKGEATEEEIQEGDEQEDRRQRENRPVITPIGMRVMQMNARKRGDKRIKKSVEGETGTLDLKGKDPRVDRLEKSPKIQKSSHSTKRKQEEKQEDIVGSKEELVIKWKNFTDGN